MASERDIQDIINTLIAEGVGEGEEGMRRIAETILNRAEQRGMTPAQVVRQRAQYTGYANPGPAAVRAQGDPAAISAARAAWELAQGPDDPTGGANHYFNPNIVTPSWASQMTPTGQFGNHAFYTDREPEPRRVAPVPATPSIDMDQMRRTAMPSQLIPDTFASLPRSSRSLGDEIAMSPIQGGRQQAPMFDAAYDERTGQMRLTREPIDSQGIAVGRSSEPAPTPAVQSAHLAAMRANDPVLQAALNAKYPAQLPPLPTPSRPKVSASDLARGKSGISTVAVIPTRPKISASDMARGNSGISTIASIPTRPQVSASDLARGKSGISTIASYPTVPQVAQATIPGPNGYTIPKGDERLPVGFNIPDMAGDLQVAKVAPIPFMRPDFPQVATALDVVPLPPLPIPRPKVAPVPFDRPNFGIGGPGFANLFGIKLPSIPKQMQTVAGRTSAFEPAMRQVMTGSPNRRTLTSAVAAQRGPGMSAQQAYDRANSAAVERAIAGASNSDAAQRLNERLGNI